MWKSDGTAAGTNRVAAAGDDNPTNPGQFTDVSGELYFEDSSTAHGRSLWKSDGTSDGTVRVADVLAANPYWGISPLTAAGGAVYFVTDQPTEIDPILQHDRQLWRNDGTAGGTTLVKAINPGTVHPFPPHGLFSSNGALYLVANAGLYGDQLYKTDGTLEGTVALTNVASGANPHDLVKVDGALYFSANGLQGQTLWKSDGTPVGTAAIAGAPGGSYLTSVNGILCYARFEPGHGLQLWRSDGIATGTFPLTDLNTGYFYGFDPSGFTVFNGAIYFSATDGDHGYQLWKTDGTAAGTIMLTRVNLPGGIYPRLLTVVDGTLFFEDVVNNQVQLWKSDGTAVGTVPVATVLNAGVQNSGEDIASVNGTLYFVIDESLGFRLWKSDGTPSGTISLAFSRSISNLVDYSGTLFFQQNDGAPGSQLWKSDGTVAGTIMVTDINPGGGGLAISELAVADGRLLFSGTDGVDGQEVWVSDGTAAGTSMVADLNPGSASSNPANFTVVDGVVFFTADDGTHGVEVWKVGAQTAGIQIVIGPSITAGIPFAATAQALNDFGGINPNYRGTVHFTLAPTGAAADYTFTAADQGAHTFAGLVLTRAGSYTVTGTDTADPTVTGSASFTVVPAAADHIALMVPSMVSAGEPFAITVTVQDAYGNTVTGYQGTVHFVLSGPVMAMADYTFTAGDQGQHTFSGLMLGQPGLYTLTATDEADPDLTGSVTFTVSGP